MKEMPRLIFLSAAVALIIYSFLGGSPVFSEEATSNGSVTVYYFHGSFRCPTCNKMEQYSKETIERDFKSEVDSGGLLFKAVNVENKENEHFVRDYRLHTKSLILSLQKDGKELRSKNLDKIWEYVRNKERFENYVRNEVAAFLREV